jgi:hypothetical protein
LLLVSLGAWVFVTSPTVADILIDDFSTDQGPVVDSTANGTPVTNGPLSPIVNTDLVNAARTISVNKLSGGAGTQPTVEVAFGEFGYTQKFVAAGQGSAAFSVEWTFNSHDLTQGGTLFGFLLQGLSYSHSARSALPLTIQVIGPSATATVTIVQPQNNATFFVPFSSFVGGNPFASATKIVISATVAVTTQAQFSLSALRVVTPEPSSIVLFGAGTLGLVLHGVRRRRSNTRK